MKAILIGSVVLAAGCGSAEVAGEPEEAGPAGADTATNDTGAVEDSGSAPSDGQALDSHVVDAAPADAGSEKVGVFVAQGHVARTMISCDDGRTWTKNRSDDDKIRCFEGIDCDHMESSGRGIALGNGVLVATFLRLGQAGLDSAEHRRVHLGEDARGQHVRRGRVRQ